MVAPLSLEAKFLRLDSSLRASREGVSAVMAEVE